MGVAGKSKGEYLWQLSRAGYLWRGEWGAEQCFRFIHIKDILRRGRHFYLELSYLQNQ